MQIAQVLTKTSESCIPISSCLTPNAKPKKQTEKQGVRELRALVQLSHKNQKFCFYFRSRFCSNNVANLSEQAFQKSFTNENFVSPLSSTGLYLFNAVIFKEDDLMPSAVTYLSLQRPEENEKQPNSFTANIAIKDDKKWLQLFWL